MPGRWFCNLIFISPTKKLLLSLKICCECWMVWWQNDIWAGVWKLRRNCEINVCALTRAVNQINNVSVWVSVYVCAFILIAAAMVVVLIRKHFCMGAKAIYSGSIDETHIFNRNFSSYEFHVHIAKAFRSTKKQTPWKKNKNKLSGIHYSDLTKWEEKTQVLPFISP